MAVVEVSRVVKRYGDLVAVDDVSFSVDAGEIFTLLGPNGAGKTSTVEILEGLRRRDSGDVRVLTMDPARQMRGLAAHIGVMPQSGDLQQGLRTGEAVRLFASFYDEGEDPAALMSRLQLDGVGRTSYRRLSGGEKKRLSLALALVGRPRVAFLDEPTAGMDVEGRSTTWDILRELKGRGAAVILTTHLLDEAERISDRVAIIQRGRVVALGSPSELTGTNRELTFSVERPIDEGALSRALGVHVEPSSTGYKITATDPDAELIARLTAWLASNGAMLRRLDVGSATLEDVYLRITGTQ